MNFNNADLCNTAVGEASLEDDFLHEFWTFIVFGSLSVLWFVRMGEL